MYAFQASEDLSNFHSLKTDRGPLKEGWRESSDPIMCSYKAITVRLDIWGVQAKLEDLIHKVRIRLETWLKLVVGILSLLFQSIREILLVGHRQAFAWIDDWYGMTLEDVRSYEALMQEETNNRMRAGLTRSVSVVETKSSFDSEYGENSASSPRLQRQNSEQKKSWFSWS